jgi:hypothetical protein
MLFRPSVRSAVLGTNVRMVCCLDAPCCEPVSTSHLTFLSADEAAPTWRA